MNEGATLDARRADAPPPLPKTAQRTRKLSERHARWLLNLYPPLLLCGIRCVAIGPGFRSCRMRVRKSLVTRNLNGTTFGGTIFSAADPVFALLFWQIFAHQDVAVRVWLKSAHVEYKRPAATALTYDFVITDEDLDEAYRALATDRRWTKIHRVEARDVHGNVCAVIDTETYIRLPRGPQREISGF